MPPQSPSTGQHSVVDDGGHSLSPFSIDEEVEKAARQAAIEVFEDFNDFSALRNDARANMIALFEPSEVLLDRSSSYGTAACRRHGVFAVYRLKGISWRESHEGSSIHSSDMECNRKRFADRSNEGYFSVKFTHRETLRQSSRAALDAACALALEAKTLMNLPKHPHISQIYGVHAEGPKAGFSNRVLEENFFLIVDEISETLKQRIAAWKKNQSYAEDRYDDLKQRQSEITQRLEVVVDIVSALEFLGSQNLVYLFHPEKCGFDSRIGRIKLFEFGHSQESGKVPYFHFSDENDMSKRVYCAPEVLKGREVTVEADVYAVGMLLWEVLILKPPFRDMNREQHMKEVVKGEKRPRLSSKFPPSMRKIMLDCWASAKRPSMADVHNKLENILFEGVDLTWKSEACINAKTHRRIKCQKSQESVHSQICGDDKKCLDNSKRIISKSGPPRISTSRNKKISYVPSDSVRANGKENDSQSTRTTRKSRDSKRSLHTESDKIRSPSIRGTKQRTKNNQATKSRRSKSMDDSFGTSQFVSSARGQRSKSMDHSLRMSGSPKIKYEEPVDTKDENRRESKNLEIRRSMSCAKSKSTQKASPLQTMSTRKLTRSPPPIEKRNTTSFLESMKNQVASIRMNLARQNMSLEKAKTTSDAPTRDRGARRSVSAKRQSSQKPKCRSSSREHLAPVSKSFAVRRSLSRGVSEERRGRISNRSLIVPPEDKVRSPRTGLTKGTSINSDIRGRRPLQKSFSGILQPTMVLGDPSRQAPGRSKSSAIVASSPNLQKKRSPVSFRRRFSGDINGLVGPLSTREQSSHIGCQSESPRVSSAELR
jgi:hypothetical protein